MAIANYRRFFRSAMFLSATFLLTAAPAEAATLHFAGTETGTINGVAVNATDNMFVDSSNGNRTLVSGPFSSSILGSVSAFDYKGADACWPGNTAFDWSPQPSPYASGSSGDVISKPLNCLNLTAGNFTRTAVLHFSTGESLTQTLVQQGVSATEFTSTATVDGTLPVVPVGTPFRRLPWQHEFTQTKSNTVHIEFDYGIQLDMDHDGTFDAPIFVTGGADLVYDGVIRLPGPELDSGTNIVVSYSTATGLIDYADTRTIAPAAGVATPVPEPTSLGLLGAGAVMMLRRRRNLNTRD